MKMKWQLGLVRDMFKAVIGVVCAFFGRAGFGLNRVPTTNHSTVSTTSRRQLACKTESAKQKLVGKWSVAPTTLPTKLPTRKPVADHLVPPTRRLIAAPKAAAAFRDWLAVHGLDDRIRAVDDVWFLASEDFAVAQGITLPPRNTFLGALQKISGVHVQYDKRIPIGSAMRKTTVYTFTRSDHAETTKPVVCDLAA
jgi:hypothetical protein